MLKPAIFIDKPQIAKFSFHSILIPSLFPFAQALPSSWDFFKPTCNSFKYTCRLKNTCKSKFWSCLCVLPKTFFVLISRFLRWCIKRRIYHFTQSGDTEVLGKILIAQFEWILRFTYQKSKVDGDVKARWIPRSFLKKGHSSSQRSRK